ncbi:cupin domain-containing protein [Tellurirhabdus bombi]|uniref:cupin domain-containing protein n=1 Tax=Tellurirhabdus bombi TaxID=2907205 RepID=UPI001F1D7A06|nr:cupin domain-containing protein [Tellurirhabdus bombi]
MAYQGKEIRNSVTGQTIRFVQTKADTKGQLLEMVSTYDKNSREPAPHYHPNQDEYFEVLEGELTVRLQGERQTLTLRPGRQLHISKNVVHAMWNESAQPTIVRWKTVPAMNTEYLLEITTGLANDGKTNASGIPGLLQVALMMPYFADVFRLAKPPRAVQKIVFGALAPLACVLGYRAFIQKYVD